MDEIVHVLAKKNLKIGKKSGKEFQILGTLNGFGIEVDGEVKLTREYKNQLKQYIYLSS